jgi:hypothetical protein
LPLCYVYHMAKLVYNIEPASPSMISSLDRHCLTRTPDGSSNIVTARSHLNRILEGDERGLMQSLKNLYARGVQKPTAQAEKPYLRIVLSASPEYFRPADPEAVGTWDEDRLATWIEATMNQLREEHGADLIFAELHLDEDTPHIHAVVAPTYSKKARKPGRQKRGETPDQFEARKAAALASVGVKTVGRASHPTLSKQGSFQQLRQRMTVAVDHLGIEYGEDRSVNAPDGMSTREWVIEQAARLREEKRQLDQERAAFEKKKLADDAELEKTATRIALGVKNLQVAINRVQDGTYDTELTLKDMPDKPKELDVLKEAASDNRLTLGFRAGFWALNFSDGSGPIPLPEKIRTSLSNSFARVASWAAEVRKGRLEAQAASREATEARKEAQALKDSLGSLKRAVEAVEAWEAEKARNAWWDMTPDARLAAKIEERKAAMYAADTGDDFSHLNEEIFQLRAETGKIIRVESVDAQAGHITGEDLRTGKHIVARIILDEVERVKHYPNRQVTGQEAQQARARKVINAVKDQITNVVAGSIVYLASLKPDGIGYIVAGVPSCQPPRLDPRLAPPPVEAEPLLDLPEDAQTKVRQALGTSSATSPSPF